MPILPALMGLLLLPGSMATSPTPAQVPPAPAGPTLVVAMTAYNAVPEQTDADPTITASGAYSNPEVVAARSRDLKEQLPFGTIIQIEGPANAQHACGYDVVSPILGYRIIADTMHQRFTNRVDVLFDTDANYVMRDGTTLNASTIFGICTGVTIRVVGKLDPAHMHKLPKTQAELARIVEGGTAALARN